jgi:hypothetical protein
VVRPGAQAGKVALASEAVSSVVVLLVGWMEVAVGAVVVATAVEVEEAVEASKVALAEGEMVGWLAGRWATVAGRLAAHLAVIVVV